MIQTKKLVLNNSGFSILESMVGLALLFIVMMAFISGMNSMKKLRGDTKGDQILNKQVNDIIENIRPNLKMYQLSYDGTKTSSERLAPDQLPMAWGNGFQSKAEDCPNCPGRFGYVIQSYDGFYGLYLVTIRFSHRDWSTVDKPTVANYGYVDYEFVVNVQ